MYIAGRFSREKHTSQLFFACESRSSLCSLIVQGRVLRALWAVHWSRLATAAGFRLLQNLCAWSGPFLLQQLLGHLQAGAAICKPPVPRNTYQRKLGHSCIAVQLMQCMSYQLHTPITGPTAYVQYANAVYWQVYRL